MSIAKKIFIVSSILLSAVLFFLGIYNVSFKREKASIQDGAKTNQSGSAGEVTNTVNKTGEAAKINSNEKIYSLSDEAIISPVSVDDGDSVEYYSKANGNVFKVFLSGREKKVISDKNLSGLEKILWSPDASRVISRFNINGQVRYSTYDYNEKKGYKLDDGIEYATWNNLGNQIFYKYFDAKSKKRTLDVADFDGKNWKKIADVNSGSIFISVIPQSSFVSFWNTPNAFEETSLSIVSTVGGEVRKIFSGRFGADFLWSPNGSKALVSFTDSRGGSKTSLGVINSNGGEFQNLNIPTFVSKCVWSKDSKTIFYTIPTFSSENNVLPNDYQSGKVSTEDTFWKMDITSGKAERVVEIKDINGSYDATNLFLSPSEDVLFFINKIDGKLYGINI
jgi:hypothetical protein